MSEISSQLKGMMEKGSRMRRVVLILLGAAPSVNLVTLARSYAASTLKRAWQWRNSQSWERAAHLLEGEQFGGFMSFVGETTPDYGSVTLPPWLTPLTTAKVGLMQCFLPA